MGLRWRKRTKGKNAWLNFSYSKKNGFNTSLSVKSGPFTWNSGNRKRPTRLTTNLPGGFYHVSSNKKKSSKSNTDNSPSTSYSSGSGSQEGLGIIGIVIVALFAGCAVNIFTGHSDSYTKSVAESLPPPQAPAAPVAEQAPPAPQPKESFAIPEIQEPDQQFQVPVSEPEQPLPESLRPSHNGDYIYRPGATPPEESTDEKVQL